MKVILIVAMTAERLIGRGGKLPWHDSDDLRHFKRTTMGCAILMGRRTWESIGKPLPGRRNIVITHNAGFTVPGVDVVHSLEEALQLCRSRGEERAFIIGGAQVYEQALSIADEMIVTRMKAETLPGDTFFPEWDEDEWSGPIAADPQFPRAERYIRRTDAVKP